MEQQQPQTLPQAPSLDARPQQARTDERGTEKNLNTAIAAIAAEITKADTKVGYLLTLDGLLVAALSLMGGKLEIPSIIVAAVGGTALVCSVVMAVMVIRPRLNTPNNRDRSFVNWAGATLDEIKADMEGDHRLARVQTLSRIAIRKMRLVRLSGDATLAAVISIAAAALLR